MKFPLLAIALLSPLGLFAQESSSRIHDAWYSDKTDGLVGLAVFERIQMHAEIDLRCKKDTKDWENCVENARISDGRAYLKISKEKNLFGDCALVKAIDFFYDGSRGEDTRNEILVRGKRMLPILQFALNHKPCQGGTNETKNICHSEKDFEQIIGSLIQEVTAGKKPNKDAL